MHKGGGTVIYMLVLQSPYINLVRIQSCFLTKIKLEIGEYNESELYKECE